MVVKRVQISGLSQARIENLHRPGAHEVQGISRQTGRHIVGQGGVTQRHAVMGPRGPEPGGIHERVGFVIEGPLAHQGIRDRLDDPNCHWRTGQESGRPVSQGGSPKTGALSHHL